MTDYIQRLRAACAEIMDEYGEYEEWSGIPHRTSGLLTVCPLRHHLVPMLQRLDKAGAEWTLAHLLKRLYVQALPNIPASTPLLSSMTRAGAVKWGGAAVWWEVGLA